MHTPPLSRLEMALLVFAALLAALAVFGPDIRHLVPAPVHAHGGLFADARTLLGVPHALDVLSNLPFALFGAWGWVWLAKRPPSSALARPQWVCMAVFFTGLLATCIGSGYYHWAPDAWGLMWDRIGMGLAFAGVLGLLVAERVSPRAALATTLVTCVSAALAAAWCAATGDVRAWACVQFGGMALVLVGAFLPAQAGSVGVKWLPLIACYALAKVLEGADASVFAATGEWVSGHSLKHVGASLAALPVLAVLRGTYHAQALAVQGKMARPLGARTETITQ